MQVVSNIQKMIWGHLEQIKTAYDEPLLRRTPYTFFADASLWEGDLTRILHPDIQIWHSAIGSISANSLLKRRGRIITRMIPLQKRDYSLDEQRLIKYVLHYQLALGIELDILFTGQKDFLDSHFESSNFSLVNGYKLVRSPKFWDPTAPEQVIVQEKKETISNLYCAFKDISRTYTVHRLSYNPQTFTCFRVKLKERFGNFLYELQSGRCAISNDPIGNEDWDVDHIFPEGNGGNNSLINLQATTHKNNIAAGATIKGSCFSLEKEELTGNLGFDFHRRLSDRKLIGIPLGNVHYLDYRLI